MRSTSFKAAFAAALLSVSAVGGFAAGPAFAVESTRSIPPIKEEAPRLEAVLEQLQSTVDGIKTENANKNLTAEQTATLEKSAAAIKASAEKIAAKHDGKIPSKQYHALLGHMEKLSLSAAIDPTPAEDENDPT